MAATKSATCSKFLIPVTNRNATLLDVLYCSPLLTKDDTGAHAAHKSLSSNKNLKSYSFNVVSIFPLWYRT